MSAIEQFVSNNGNFIFLGICSVLSAFFIWNLFMQLHLRQIKKTNEIFFAGNKVKNLEELLLDQAKDIQELDKDIQELFNISNQINRLASRGIHKIGIVRFNPFKDVGGDQSFAIALLNGKNSGITISSLYTREGTRIYSKSIIEGKSDKHILTEEEKEAIDQAIGNKNKKL